jgi:hypothetical protein
MNIERWRDIIGNIKDNFQVEEEGKSEGEEEGDPDAEFIIFQGPLGRMKLELKIRPVILDKKTIYSNRIGSETKVEYIYSKDETSVKMKAYIDKEGDGGWVEIEAANFG